MEYLVNGNKYSFSYRELKEKYYELSFLPLEDFLARLGEVLHFCCIVSYIKEVNISTLGDEGLIHQLVHLLHISDEPLIDAEKIKEQFVEEMRIV